MTKIVVTGSRNWTDREFILSALKTLAVEPPVLFIHGACRGVDLLAASCANDLGWTVKPVRADWSRFGLAAGPIRNVEMLEEKPDIVVAFHDDIGSSSGTANCIKEAKARNIPVKMFTHFQRITDSVPFSC